MLRLLGSRRQVLLLAGIVPLLSLLAVVPAPSAGARSAEPAMVTPAADRRAAVGCSGDLEAAPRPPVLLVPGTGITPQENWAPTYWTVLIERGHPVCTVRLPSHATRDVQINAEYVATAIRAIGGRSARPLSVIGHSQGALLPQVALRTWPSLVTEVDDIIGLGGVYDHGSEDLRRRCATRCAPALHQMTPESTLLASVSRHRLPAGPSYTNIGTSADATVTPQPSANQQTGARSILVEDVCQGRSVPEPAHAMIAGDAVAHALIIDALDHPGSPDPGRIDPATCQEQSYPEFDSTQFLGSAASAGSRLNDPTTHEPRLLCRYDRTCRDARLRGHLTTRPAVRIWARAVVVRARAHGPGQVKVRLGHHIVKRNVAPGPFTLKIRRPRTGDQLQLKTRTRHYSAWATEATKHIPRRTR